MATVTYLGSDGAISHPAPSGRRYTMHRKQPCKIADEDVAFYRKKEAQGSPFRVEPKLGKEVVKEPFHETEKPVKKLNPRKGRKGKGNIPKKPDNQPSRRTRTNIPKSEIFI